MKKFILGAAVGAGIGVALAYLAAKAQENGCINIDQIRDKADEMALKAKKKAKDAWDLGKNEAEYIMDRAENAIKKGRNKNTEATEL